MRPHQTDLRIDRIRMSRSRRENRLAKWVGLLALAGLLAIATLPSHGGHQADGDTYGSAHMENGGATWHG